MQYPLIIELLAIRIANKPGIEAQRRSCRMSNWRQTPTVRTELLPSRMCSICSGTSRHKCPSEEISEQRWEEWSRLGTLQQLQTATAIQRDRGIQCGRPRQTQWSRYRQPLLSSSPSPSCSSTSVDKIAQSQMLSENWRVLSQELQQQMWNHAGCHSWSVLQKNYCRK